MSDLADRMIDALRSGHDDLARYVEGMDESALAGPSGSSEWDVSHVLSHLGSGAEIGLATLESALAGGKGPDVEFMRGIWARWDAMPAVEHRDGFLLANRRLVERYEALDQQTRDELPVDMGFIPEPVSVAESARLRLSEFAYHAWDVKVGTDPTATLAPEAVPLLLDGAAWLAGHVARPDALRGRQAALVVQTSDPTSTIGLRLGETVSLGDVPSAPDGTLTAPAEAWLRLIVGRLAPAVTPPGVEATGSVSLDDLRRVFPGF